MEVDCLYPLVFWLRDSRLLGLVSSISTNRYGPYWWYLGSLLYHGGRRIGRWCAQARWALPISFSGKFFTKYVVNVKAVARTFKPLWKLFGELKIWDIGGNLLLFEFDDAMDLERVLEFEPWTYDKSLVVFQRVVDAEFAPLLAFNSI